MNEWIETSALVLAKCAANDPWFPNPGEALVKAWAEVFAGSHLSREDLLAGVARAYRIEDEGFRPLPASIVKHARAAYFEALGALDDGQRDQMLTMAYELEDMGFPPPLAQKHVRRVALGRSPAIDLSDQQRAELVDRVRVRLALQPRVGVAEAVERMAAANK